MPSSHLAATVAIPFFLLAALPGVSSGGDAWHNWRGPTQSGAASANGLPDSLSLESDLLWRAPLPGPGASTPLVCRDRIYLTCVVDGQNTACCYAMDGAEQWRASVGSAVEAKHRVATGANPSAATNGEHLVVYFKSGDLACFALAGDAPSNKPLWSLNLQERYGEDTLWWDLGSSPAITAAGPGGGVVVPILQDNLGLLVCLDLATGEQRWAAKRDYATAEESGQAYTTPMIVSVAGQEQVVTFGADHLTGHDAASGDRLWEVGGFNPQNKGMWRVIASPVVAEGIVLTPYGRADWVAAHRLGPAGVMTDADLVWRREGIGADAPTPAVSDGRAYVLGDKGSVTCLNLTTGETVWADRLARSRNKYYASPLVAGDKLLLAREDGFVTLARIGAGLEVLSTLELDETMVASPVAAAGHVLLRTRKALYCFSN